MTYLNYLRNTKESKRDILSKWCCENFKKQQKIEKLYKKYPNEILIRDKNKNYKRVTKNYYLYYIEEDEYDTETELEDPEWVAEVQRIQNKYNNKNI